MFNKWIVAIILVLAIILAQPVVAADDTNNDEEISIDYVFESGMPASTTLLKDNDGFIWLPTQNGLVRYDAYDTLVYRTGDNSVSHDYIANIYEDSKGMLWIGTQGGGLDVYDKERNLFFIIIKWIQVSQIVSAVTTLPLILKVSLKTRKDLYGLLHPKAV